MPTSFPSLAQFSCLIFVPCHPGSDFPSFLLSTSQINIYNRPDLSQFAIARSVCLFPSELLLKRTINPNLGPFLSHPNPFSFFFFFPISFVHVSPQNDLQALSSMLLKINLLKVSQYRKRSALSFGTGFQGGVEGEVTSLWTCTAFSDSSSSEYFFLHLPISLSSNRKQKPEMEETHYVATKCQGLMSLNYPDEPHLWLLPTNPLQFGPGAVDKLRPFFLILFG